MEKEHYTTGMKIEIRVKTNSREEKLEEISENQYKAWVKEEPKENKANIAVVKLLSKYFKIPPSLIKLLQGAKGKNKIFEIQGVGVKPKNEKP